MVENEHLERKIICIQNTASPAAQSKSITIIKKDPFEISTNGTLKANFETLSTHQEKEETVWSVGTVETVDTANTADITCIIIKRFPISKTECLETLSSYICV
jgi:hypothetical protein